MSRKKGRLLIFRGGDRSEYLALFLVSRFAYLIPVPRQEDFGLADFICFVGREEDPFFHAEDAFLLQIKSNKRKIQLKTDPSNYLKKHADLPLIICVASTGKKLIQFYSSWRLWCYLSLRETSNISKINLVFDKYAFGDEVNSKAFRVRGEVLEVALGSPFLSIEQNDLENRKFDDVYSLIKFWLEIERLNLVGLRTGKSLFYGIKSWKPNVEPNNEDREVYYQCVPQLPVLEKMTVNWLTALCYNYDEAGASDKIEIISDFLKTLPEEFFNEISKNYRNWKSKE